MIGFIPLYVMVNEYHVLPSYIVKFWPGLRPWKPFEGWLYDLAQLAVTFLNSVKIWKSLKPIVLSRILETLLNLSFHSCKGGSQGWKFNKLTQEDRIPAIISGPGFRTSIGLATGSSTLTWRGEVVLNDAPFLSRLRYYENQEHPLVKTPRKMSFLQQISNSRNMETR